MGIDGAEIKRKSSSAAKISEPRHCKEIQEKSLPIAIGLNFVFPGIGYMYMGKWLLGIVAAAVTFFVFFTAGFFYLLQAWIGMNVIMAVDMMILSNKLKKNIEKETTVKCPQCAELIKKEALVCRFCGNKLKQNKEAVV